MLMKGNLWFVNRKVLEQQTCFARIFTGDDVNFSQCLEGAQRNISEISYRSGNQVQHCVIFPFLVGHSCLCEVSLA